MADPASPGPARRSAIPAAVGTELDRVDQPDEDWTRVAELIEGYADLGLGLGLGLVDATVVATVVAVAERLRLQTSPLSITAISGSCGRVMSRRSSSGP
jgi:hypothetical protein